MDQPHNWLGYGSDLVAQIELYDFIGCVFPRIFLRKYRRFPKSTEGNLGGWCHTQRKMRKQGKLPNDRRLLLDKIGFVWSAEQVWQGNFEQLCLFHNLQGRWPGCREGALGRWCTIQRRDYRKGNMSDERKAQLERIGFPLA